MPSIRKHDTVPLLLSKYCTCLIAKTIMVLAVIVGATPCSWARALHNQPQTMHCTVPAVAAVVSIDIVR